MRLPIILSVLVNWSAATTVCTQPIAETLNGTYRGIYSPEWEQDFFLGMPFAQPPIGNLRYRWPQSLNSSFSEVKSASQYGLSCMQDGNWSMSEDCLTLNVVSPRGPHSKLLPVLVWIYGGGLGAGTTADPQYNVSGIVKVSQEIDQPVIGVSINYRLGSWGFLQSPQILAEGSSNAGLLDQRMALHWIQENIQAFGGDPRRVVVWGESAGAQSIAYQMLGYNGRDDGLFHGAIMESGGPTGCPVNDLSFWTAPFQNLSHSNGCLESPDQIGCLRNVSSADLFAARPKQEWQSPLIDGDFLGEYPSQQLPQGHFVQVPIITGHNTNEGFSFNPSNTWNTPCPLIDTEEQLLHSFMGWRTYVTSPPTIKKLMELYPLEDNFTTPHYSTICGNLETTGKQLGRAAAIGGDMVMIAGRRRLCELFTQPGVRQDVYSYRFDTQPFGRSEGEGVQHFDNVAFSFQNISGLLGPSPRYDSHRQLSRAIGEAYVRFVNTLDPNPDPQGVVGQSNSLLPYWPRYSRSEPVNLVLNASYSYIEADVFRKEGIAFINSQEVARELGG